jgi:hypothetical protein
MSERDGYEPGVPVPEARTQTREGSRAGSLRPYPTPEARRPR